MVSRNVCVYVANLGNTSNIHTPIYGHKCIWKLTLRRIIPVCVKEMTFTTSLGTSTCRKTMKFCIYILDQNKIKKVKVYFPIFRQQFVKKYVKCSVYSCECQLRQILQLVLKWTYIVKIGHHKSGWPRNKSIPNSKISKNLVSSKQNTTQMKKWAWLKHFFQYLLSNLIINATVRTVRTSYFSYVYSII